MRVDELLIVGLKYTEIPIDKVRINSLLDELMMGAKEKLESAKNILGTLHAYYWEKERSKKGHPFILLTHRPWSEIEFEGIKKETVPSPYGPIDNVSVIHNEVVFIVTQKLIDYSESWKINGGKEIEAPVFHDISLDMKNMPPELREIAESHDFLDVIHGFMGTDPLDSRLRIALHPLVEAEIAALEYNIYSTQLELKIVIRKLAMCREAYEKVGDSSTSRGITAYREILKKRREQLPPILKSKFLRFKSKKTILENIRVETDYLERQATRLRSVISQFLSREKVELQGWALSILKPV